MNKIMEWIASLIKWKKLKKTHKKTPSGWKEQREINEHMKRRDN